MSGFPNETPTGKTDYETPKELFDSFDRMFRFDMDAAATKDNRLCTTWRGPGAVHEDALDKDWPGLIAIWCNPPYVRGMTTRWLDKAIKAAMDGSQVLMLLPFRPENRWWSSHVKDKADTVFMLEGRVSFVGGSSSAQVPFAGVLYTPQGLAIGRTRYVNWRWKA